MILGYCLMSSHVHLIAVLNGNLLSILLRRVHGCYAQCLPGIHLIEKENKHGLSKSEINPASETSALSRIDIPGTLFQHIWP